MQEDYELNQLLHLATEDTMELAGALQVQQQTALQLLGMQLLPCEAAAAEAARMAVGKQQHEVGVVEKLPLLDLTEPVRVAGGQGSGPAGEHDGYTARPRYCLPDHFIPLGARTLVAQQSPSAAADQD